MFYFSSEEKIKYCIETCTTPKHTVVGHLKALAFNYFFNFNEAADQVLFSK